jgi:23S rRNA (guanosine2251-2'-O)-methyltransferase
MKPPHGNRPGGSARPPSDRGPYRGPGGHAPRPPGSGGGGQRSEARAGYGGGKTGDPGHRGHPKPRPEGPRHDGPRSEGPRHDGPRFEGPRHDAPRRDGPHSDGPRSDGPRSDGPRPEAPRHDGKRPFGKPAARGDFQPRPPRDAAPQRYAASPQRHRDPDAPRGAPDAPKGTVWLYGHHAVAAALANPNRRLRRLLLTEEAEAALGKLLPPPWAVSPERVERSRLDTLLGRDIVHQGAALLADPLAPPSLQSVLEKPGVIIVLDQVTDPRNVGAIMRSAAAFGAAAVITQDRNAPEETGGLAKAASGALEKMPLLRAVNIARTIIALKAANVWCIGLDAAGKALSGPAFSDRRVALVLGAEGEGLRRLTRETCDEIAGLTIKGAVESLNVSAAASVALYELSRR